MEHEETQHLYQENQETTRVDNSTVHTVLYVQPFSKTPIKRHTAVQYSTRTVRTTHFMVAEQYPDGASSRSEFCAVHSECYVNCNYYSWFWQLFHQASSCCKSQANKEPSEQVFLQFLPPPGHKKGVFLCSLCSDWIHFSHIQSFLVKFETQIWPCCHLLRLPTILVQWLCYQWIRFAPSLQSNAFDSMMRL